MIKYKSIYIGFDPREAVAFDIARHTANKRLTQPLPVAGVVLDSLHAKGLYTRPTERRGDGRLFDELSKRDDYDGAMSTEFAISRFLVPHLAERGWALFMDCDVMVRENLVRLFDLADPKYAVMVVKHDFNPAETVKMDGQLQSRYSRKNWSSVCLWNVDHPANKALTLDLINSAPGRDLHAFSWLDDELIGELPAEWNYLVGHTKGVDDPAIVHFTDGIPTMPGYENCEYADEWRGALARWAA